MLLIRRRKKEEGRRKKEEGRRKKEEGRRKKEEVKNTYVVASFLFILFYFKLGGFTY
ncbi:hypothetical protein [Phormidium nigroviride]